MKRATPIDVAYAGLGVPLPWVTFDLYHTPPTLTLVHRLMSLRTQVQLRAVSSWRGACLRVKGWQLCGGGVAPPTQGVGRAIVLGVWCSGTDVIVCILMLLRLCCVSGNVCGFLVVSQIFIENGRP